jgi:Imm-5 like putative immunity protein
MGKTKRPRLVRVDLDQRITELVRRTDQRTLAVWACDCAERVMPYFERRLPDDERPRMAIEAGREWARTGEFRMAAVRKASLGAHSAARQVKDDAAARSAARAAGQAVATAHVPRHAIGAAVYAATAVRDAEKASDADAAVSRERDWQYRHLLGLRRSALETERDGSR